MKVLKNILLISGSGRNCGKTTVACHAINQLAEFGQVYGLKITPHFHLTASNQYIVAEGDGYRIFRETDTQSGKDSARMLKAGAKEVYFIQCFDEDLAKVYTYLKKLIPDDCPIVCESGSLASQYKPGLHLLIEGNTVDAEKTSYQKNRVLADFVITQKEFAPEEFPFKLEFLENHWKINSQKQNCIRRSA